MIYPAKSIPKNVVNNHNPIYVNVVNKDWKNLFKNANIKLIKLNKRYSSANINDHIMCFFLFSFLKQKLNASDKFTLFNIVYYLRVRNIYKLFSIIIFAMEDKDIVALVWLSNIILPLIIPVIIMFILKDKSNFHRKHFNYILNLLIIEILATVLLFILSFIAGILTGGLGAVLIFPLFGITMIYNLIVSILGAIKAHNGEEEVPLIPLLIHF